jgi:uncharacterized membrane protein
VIVCALLVALIGFADATYLTIEHYQGRIPPCSITGGCEQVLTSPYSTLFGVPTSLLGVVYYVIILAGLFGYFESKNTRLLKWTLLFTTLGFGMSLWFVYLQVFVIHSFCAYCLGSAATSTILFVIAMGVFSHQELTAQSFTEQPHLFP